MLTQDNTKIRTQVMSLLNEGKNMFNNSDDFNRKEQGMYKMVEGLKLFQVWIPRETDPAFIAKLKELYNQNIDEVQKMRKYLEDHKNKNEESTGGQAMKSRKPGGKDDDEKDKMKQGLADAIVTEKPNIKWDDIAGLEGAKKALQEAVILPIKFPQIFTGVRKPWRGILLYGPPGTGKTYLAKACATEAAGTFFSVSSSDLVSKYVGESEKLIKTLFAMAREKAPSIIFIDEVDSMCGSRSDGENEASRRIKTEFLVQMQGVGNDNDKLLVLGATNLPWALDPAIRRRFEKRIYIPLPEAAARQKVFEINLKKTPHTLSHSDFERLGHKTEGFSAADISIVVRDAVMEPVRQVQTCTEFAEIQENGKIYYEPCLPTHQPAGKRVTKSLLELNGDQLRLPNVSMADFEVSLMKAKPSVGKDQLKEYEKFTMEFGQEG